MDYDIVTRDAMELVGIETRASNAEPEKIGAHWARYISDINTVGDFVVAVYCEYEGNHTKPYTLFIGYPVSPDAETPAGCTRRRVEGGKFARFVSVGEQPGAMIALWSEIHGLHLGRRYEGDYELHPVADDSRVEIYVGVT